MRNIREREIRPLGTTEVLTVRDEHGHEGPAVIRGLVAPYYDGTDATQYVLWDGAVERYMPGAFERALSAGADVRCLWNHDTSYPLGRTTNGTLRLFESERGLEYECTLNDTTIGADITKHLARGDVSGSSAGFFVDLAQWRTDEDGLEIRELRALDLFDCSPCTFPAYEGTPTSLKRARDEYETWKRAKGPTIDLLRCQLDLASIET